LFESLFRLGIGHPGEDRFWQSTLRGLAARFGVNGEPQQRTVLVDPRLQWSEARNLWHNAAIRSALYMPVAIARKVLRRS
jgi:hypothetical protein